MKRIGLHLLWIIFAASYFCSCGTKEEKSKKVDIGFSQYVSSLSTGVKSVESTVKIRLTKKPKIEIKVGEELEKGLFSIQPKTEGQVYWKDEQTIEFRPKTRLANDTKYNVKLQLGKLLDVVDKYKELKFSFNTIKQTFGVTGKGVQSYDDQSMVYQKYTGHINCADAIDGDQIAKILEVQTADKSFPISWTHSSNRKTHYFVIDSIQRKEDSQALMIKWDGKKIGVDDKGTLRVEIPALNDFKVINAFVTHNPQQVVVINFSDPIKPDQDLNGLIRINGASNFKYTPSGNQLHLYPNRRLTGTKKVQIEEGVRNIKNYSLKESKEYELLFEDVKPAVILMGKGVISPSSQGLMFPFTAVGLRAVDLRVIEIYKDNVHQFFQDNKIDEDDNLKRVGRLVLQKRIDLGTNRAIDLRTWNAFTVDIADHMKVTSGAIYRVELRFRKSYSLYGKTTAMLDEEILGDDKLEEETENELDTWDGPGWYSSHYYPARFNWSDRDDPSTSSYYYYERFVSRNIFGSDLGIIAKGGSNNKMMFIVSNLVTAQPESGVKLKVYNYQKQLMEEVITNSDGIVSVDLKRKPFLLVAEKDDQFGYLRLDDGSSLSLSNFDVSGKVVQRGIKGYIYGERGVWRPGDKIYLTFIMEDAQKQLPKDHPVIFKLINPQGQTVVRKVSSSGVNGFYSFECETDPDAITGNWSARISVGGVTFRKSLKVETVKPNRLKINLDFNTKQLKTGAQEAQLEVKWLHGAVAANLNTNITLRLSPIKTSFKQLKGYVFDDKTKEFDADDQILFDGRVDSNGKAKVALNLKENKLAPGMLRAGFITRAFEESGDFSIDMQSVPFAPYKSFVGFKMPADRNGWYLTDTDYDLNIATVDADGNFVNRDNIDIEIYKIDWRWWWDSSSNNLASYISRSSTRKVQTQTISTKNGRAKFNINIHYRSWRDYGRYLIRIVDTKSGHSACKTAYFSKWYGYTPTDGSQNATMLSFTSDKKSYMVGEKANITIPSSKIGKALVSIETGDKVLNAYWVDTQKEKTNFEIEITPDMAPNCYVHISFIQPHGHSDNDRPIRLYGVIPLMVEDPNTHLKPVIEMPEVLKPEEDFEVKVSETNGKPMTYTVAVVDEGLLDLTRFRTPSPWGVFYAREALGVKTWDMYDMVMGAFGARLEKAFAIGGDGSGNSQKKEKANRFKPVTIYYGPFELKPGETKSHTLKMPNYVGSVRTMVVAGHDGAYGSSDKTTPVRKPLMVLGTLPRVVGPTEKVKLPVTIFAMEEQVKNVNVEIQSNDLLTINGKSSKQLRFDKLGEKVVTFDFDVAEKLGVARVKIVATSGSHKATYDIELDVRNPNPSQTVVTDTLLQDMTTWKRKVKLFGMKGTNSAVLEVSNIPPINLGKRLEYLISYPHGCIEQTTSSVFPQLFLNKLVELTAKQQGEITENVQKGLTRLLSFQTRDGGFSYWPGGYYSSDWGTSYAGHFMIKAEEAGYTLPVGLKSQWIKHQKNRAQNWRRVDTNRSTQLLQAYRLYTLALAGEADLGAMNRLREQRKLPSNAKWRLANCYSLIGRNDVAEELIQNLDTDVEPYREHSYSFGSDSRDKAMILQTLTAMKKREMAFPLVKRVAKDLSSQKWMSTQTTAYCLLSMSEYIGGESRNNLEFKYSINGGGVKKIGGNMPIIQIPIECLSNEIECYVEPSSKDMLYARIITTGTPVAGNDKEQKNNLEIEVYYTNMEGKYIDEVDLRQGTDFIAVVRVKNPGRMGDYSQMALTQIFPSGWEIVNTRFGDVDSDTQVDRPTYQDIRDDRVYTYFNIKSGKSKQFVISLNAAYVGKYYLPAVGCQAMYDNEISATEAGRWVTVSPQK